jgi:RNA polymerase sigma-70 factor (sigma-E family)
VEQEPQVTFDGVVAARGQRLQRTAYLLTGDWALAEDLLQTALARAYPRWRWIEGDDPEAYVRKILVNTWSSWWRRRWRGEVPTETLPDRPARSGHSSGDDEYDAVDRRDALESALARLPKRQRAVVVLRYHDDLTEAQVASLLGISVGTVKSQASKAFRSMRSDTALTGYGAAVPAGGE